MTVSQYYYSKSIEYTTGKYSGNFEYGSVSGIDNLKKYEGVAKLNVGKDTATKNRPAKLTLRQFGISLPAGAEINSVTVEYAHRKVKGSNQKKAPNILAPTISLVGFGSENNPDLTGVAPTTTMKNRTVTFNFKPSKAKVESDIFGVHIKYPKNKNDASGHVELQYIRIKIDYTEPKYQVSMIPLRSNVIVGEKNQIILSIGNLNKTNYRPSIPISLDSGVVFNKVTEGNVSSSNNNVVWNPQLSNNKVGDTAIFEIYCSTSGNKTINLSFTLNGITYSRSCKFNVNPPTVPETVDSETEEIIITEDPSTNNEIIQVVVDEPFSINFDFETPNVIQLYACIINENTYGASYENWSTDYCTSNIYMYKSIHGQWTWESITEIIGNGQNATISPMFGNSNAMTNKFKCTVPGEYVIAIYDNTNTRLKQINLSVRPKNLTIPEILLFTLRNEELNRLGDTIPYNVKTLLKLNSSEHYIREWGNNFIIGVFNNSIESNISELVSFSSFNNDSVTATLNLPSNVTEYEVEYDNEINIVENTQNIIFSMSEYSIVNIKIHFKDENSNIVVTGEYIIDFENQIVNLIVNDYDSTDYNNLSYEEIFKNAEYWSNSLSIINQSEEKSVEFNYDENYPLYIIIAGDYLESNMDSNISFNQPILYESGSLESNNPQVFLPIPINNIMKSDDISTLEIPSGRSSNPFVLYDFDVGEIFGTGDTMAIRGLVFSMNVDYTDDLILTAKLISPEGKIGTRSIIIDGFDSTENSDDINNIITIGGTFDLWGFKISEMVNLDGWSLIIEVDNPYVNENDLGTLIFSNVTLSFYYLNIQDELIIAYINGEDNRHYGMFLQNIEVPAGLNSEVKYYDIENCDFNNPYRMNIDKKEINLEFGIHGCTIFETTQLLKEIAKLLTNKRDNLNRPIPNRIEFNHYPQEHWDYILEDPIDSDVESADYESKVKLTIFDGTSWANEDTSVSWNGYNDSIAGVTPVIEVSPTGDFVELTESITGQHFSLKYDNYVEGDVIIIDCTNREVTLKQYDPTLERYINYDISEDADYNVDWFILPIGEFAFEGNGTCSRCIVTFTQRG